jgi:hypothetical protein
MVLPRWTGGALLNLRIPPLQWYLLLAIRGLTANGLGNHCDPIPKNLTQKLQFRLVQKSRAGHQLRTYIRIGTANGARQYLAGDKNAHRVGSHPQTDGRSLCTDGGEMKYALTFITESLPRLLFSRQLFASR